MSEQLHYFTTPITDMDILTAFVNCAELLTRRQIAFRLFRKPHPALVARIDRLASEGYLERTQQRLPNGVDMYQYRRAVELSESR